ncbi:MAG: PEP-CTERM sorting domain-containing protein [Verrucomicrobia bacterium]|nr:PEP-CTERM sorting domain-containing protein [Verrucomicrobiota bacterium]
MGLLTFTAVPESQTIILVLAGGLFLAVMHRRMRRTAAAG